MDINLLSPNAQKALGKITRRVIENGIVYGYIYFTADDILGWSKFDKETSEQILTELLETGITEYKYFDGEKMCVFTEEYRNSPKYLSNLEIFEAEYYGDWEEYAGED